MWFSQRAVNSPFQIFHDDFGREAGISVRPRAAMAAQNRFDSNEIPYAIGKPKAQRRDGE
jgi:hypothetical protein